MHDESLVLELFEELLELEVTERPAVLENRLQVHDDASWIRRRVASLFGLEAGLGEVLPDENAGGFRGILSELEDVARSEPLAAGIRIGEFELGGVLGRGGSSTVYLAIQESPAREVALKVLEGAGARLKGEADLIGGLTHPSIATVFAAGVSEGRSWLAMELVPNARNLELFLQGASEGLILRKMIEVLEAVEFGHARGIVHGDLKPANLLVDPSERVRVIDYGVAAFRRNMTVVEEGSCRVPTIGTPAYMAPELFRERDLKDPVDAVSADVFALGVTLLELLLRRPARNLDGLELAAVIQKVSSEPIRIPEDEGLSRSLIWVLRRALAESPARRYGSAAEFAGDLVAILASRPVARATSGGGWRARMGTMTLRVRRNRIGLLGVALLGGLVGFGLQQGRWSNSDEHKELDELQGERESGFRTRLEEIVAFGRGAEREPGSVATKRRILERGVLQLQAARADAESLGPGALLVLGRALLDYGALLARASTAGLEDFESVMRAYVASESCLKVVEKLGVDGPQFEELSVLQLSLLAGEASLSQIRGDGETALIRLDEWEQTLAALLVEGKLDEIDATQLESERAPIAGLRAEIHTGLLLCEEASGDRYRQRVFAETILAKEGAEDLAPGMRRQVRAALQGTAVLNLHFERIDESLEALAEALDLVEAERESRPGDVELEEERWGLRLVEVEALRLSEDFTAAVAKVEAMEADLDSLSPGTQSPQSVRERRAQLDARLGQVYFDEAEATWQREPDKSKQLREAGAAAYGRAIGSLQNLDAQGLLGEFMRRDLDRYKLMLTNVGLAGPAPLRE